MQNLYLIFISFTILIFIVNFTLIIRAYITYKPDEFVNTDTPLISILVPAYNEEVSIVDSVTSLLNQDYSNFEIIIIDDGSSDGTFDKAKRYFSGNNKVQIFTKENNGKAMALNYGAIHAKGEFLMCIDADTILVPHAVRTMISKKKPGVDAVAAMVGINNEYTMVNGSPKEVFVPSKLTTRIQWLEYMRSYVSFRCSMKDKNIITVISGACGLISKEMLETCGGYKKAQLGEDMELTMNIHANGGKVQFISETLAWTEAPNNLKDLGKQRVRWFRGALQAFIEHKNLLFKKGNFSFNWFLLPYVWISDIFGIWVEVLSWLILAYLIATDSLINWDMFFIVWGFIMLGHYINTLLVLRFVKTKLEIKYKSVRRGFFLSMFEGVSFHFVYLGWLVKAHLQQIFGVTKKWNKLKRVGHKVE